MSFRPSILVPRPLDYQRVVAEEVLLLRWMGRRALRVDVAGGMVAMNEQHGTRLSWLTPVTTPPQVDGLLAMLAPGLAIVRDDWRARHPRAWWRLVTAPSVLLLCALTAALLLAHGGLNPGPALARWLELAWVGSLSLLCLVWLHAFGWTRFARYAIDAHSLAFRSGWLARQWQVIELSRIQAVLLHGGPLDRWNGMANVAVEVAGTGHRGYSIEIPFLPHAEAQVLFERLSRAAQCAVEPVQSALPVAST